jgi:hypothetical protein
VSRDIILRLMKELPEDVQLPKDLAEFDADIAKLERTKAAQPAVAVQPEQAAR